MIDYKSLNLFLLFVLGVLLFMLYTLNGQKEGFEDMESSMTPDFLNSESGSVTDKNVEEEKAIKEITKDEDEHTSLEAMFKNLEQSEVFCDDMERRERNREKETRIEINQMAKQQLEAQKRRIDELKSVLEFLKKEKLKRSQVGEKCRANTQNKMNKDVKLVKKLSEQGLIPNEKTVLNIKLSDDLKEIVESIKQSVPDASVEHFSNPAPRFSSDQCPHVNTKDFIHVSDLAQKCVGCNASELVRNINYINRDFQ